MTLPGRAWRVNDSRRTITCRWTDTRLLPRQVQTLAPVRQICVSWSPYREPQENRPSTRQADDGTSTRQADNGPSTSQVDNGPSADQVENGPSTSQVDNGRSRFDPSAEARCRVGCFSLENNPWQLHVILGPGIPESEGPGVGPSFGAIEGSSTVAPLCTSGDILTQAFRRLWTGRVRGGLPQKASTTSSSETAPASLEAHYSVPRDRLGPLHAGPSQPQGMLDKKSVDSLGAHGDSNPHSLPLGGPACYSTSREAATVPLSPLYFTQGDGPTCKQSPGDRPCSGNSTMSGNGAPAPVPLAVSKTSQIICLAPSVLQPPAAYPTRNPYGVALRHVPPDEDHTACDRTFDSIPADGDTQTACTPSAVGGGSTCGEAVRGPSPGEVGWLGFPTEDRGGAADGSAGTLQMVWAHAARGLAQMHVNDDLVAAATSNGTLYLLDATSGRTIRCAASVSPPAPCIVPPHNHLQPL